MPDSLPCLILTGASGIVGRSFLPAAVPAGDRELLLHYIQDLESTIGQRHESYRPTEPPRPEQRAAGSSAGGPTE